MAGRRSWHPRGPTLTAVIPARRATKGGTIPGMHPLLPADARVTTQPPICALDGVEFPLADCEANPLLALAPQLTGRLPLNEAAPTAEDAALIRQLHERGAIFDLPITGELVPTSLYCDYLYTRITRWRTHKQPGQWPWREVVASGQASVDPGHVQPHPRLCDRRSRPRGLLHGNPDPLGRACIRHPAGNTAHFHRCIHRLAIPSRPPVHPRLSRRVGNAGSRSGRLRAGRRPLPALGSHLRHRPANLGTCASAHPR